MKKKRSRSLKSVLRQYMETSLPEEKNNLFSRLTGMVDSRNDITHVYQTVPVSDPLSQWLVETIRLRIDKMPILDLVDIHEHVQPDSQLAELTLGEILRRSSKREDWIYILDCLTLRVSKLAEATFDQLMNYPLEKAVYFRLLWLSKKKPKEKKLLEKIILAGSDQFNTSDWDDILMETDADSPLHRRAEAELQKLS